MADSLNLIVEGVISLNPGINQKDIWWNSTWNTKWIPTHLDKKYIPVDTAKYWMSG